MSIIGDAINLAGRAKELADALANIELKETIAELRGKLLDLKEEILHLREQNTNLRAEAAKLTLPPELTQRDGAYYKSDGDGPFCTGCYDNNQKQTRLADQTGPFRRISRWRCPVCKSNFGTAPEAI